jgi:prepilin-type N-terminal cleavage/methylation domain-containing protein
MGKGYTMIEMMFVVIVVGLLASTLLGRLMVQREGELIRDSIQKIETAADKAEQLAISTGAAHILRFDEGTQTLTVTTDDTQDSQSQGLTNADNPRLNDLQQNDDGTVARERLGQGWRVDQVVNNLGETENQVEIRFYPDGTADAKQVQFTNNDINVVLRVTAEGQVTVSRSQVDTNEVQEWEAGQLEQRQG